MTRVEEIELGLKAISMPFLVVEVTEFGRKWKPEDFPELTALWVAELEEIANNLKVNL